MPFVNIAHRAEPRPEIPGDRCFVEYRRMMEKWRDNPRWTTVDFLASRIWPEPWRRAAILAFLVFFALHVMPYEIKKQEENGDI